MTPRGFFRSEANAKQLVKFEGMRWGSITPTDVDGFIDFGNRLFVFIEAKYGDTTMPDGQRLALERLCDACHGPELCSVGFVVQHQASPDQAIDLSQARVTRYRWKQKWSASKDISLLQGIEWFRQKVFPKPPDEHAEWIAAYEREEARQFGGTV